MIVGIPVQCHLRLSAVRLLAFHEIQGRARDRDFPSGTAALQLLLWRQHTVCPSSAAYVPSSEP
jgi:hypothetical protein